MFVPWKLFLNQLKNTLHFYLESGRSTFISFEFFVNSFSRRTVKGAVM